MQVNWVRLGDLMEWLVWRASECVSMYLVVFGVSVNWVVRRYFS